MIRRAVLVVLIALGLSAHAAPRRRPIAPVRGMAEVKRVVMVVLENTDAPLAMAQPVLAQLAARGALLRDYHAITHPSQPNYIAMFAGSQHGVVGSDAVLLDVPHLGDLLERRGLRWKVYAEDYPGDCFLGMEIGRYVRRHQPFISFLNVQKVPARCANIVNALQFDADRASGSLPDFALYIPDLDHDGHDTGVAAADLWLSSRFGPVLTGGWLPAGTLFIVVFDEGSSDGPNIVYTSFYGAGVAPGAVSTARYDHYDLLRTIEGIFRLDNLGQNDVSARVIGDIWR